jgi:hypothetical protein
VLMIILEALRLISSTIIRPLLQEHVNWSQCRYNFLFISKHRFLNLALWSWWSPPPPSTQQFESKDYISFKFSSLQFMLTKSLLTFEIRLENILPWSECFMLIQFILCNQTFNSFCDLGHELTVSI